MVQSKKLYLCICLLKRRQNQASTGNLLKVSNMSVTIHKVNSKDDLKKFVQFGIDLYEGNEYYVPPLVYDERATLNRSKNPAFDHCDANYFMAYRDGEIVGRIGVIMGPLKRYGEVAWPPGFYRSGP